MFCKEHHLIHDSTVDWNVNGKKWGSVPNTDQAQHFFYNSV